MEDNSSTQRSGAATYSRPLGAPQTVLQHGEGSGGAVGKRVLYPVLFALTFFLAAAENTGPKAPQNLPDHSAVKALQCKATYDDQTKAAFALAEVHKQLESNPETKLIDLSIDPDYNSTGDTYLVNVVLEVHEQKIMLGALVTLHPVANGWVTTVGYVD